MKTIIKIIAAIITTAVVTLGMLYVVAGDRFMPWVPQEYIYVATTQAKGTLQEPGGYLYQADYISESGKRGKITFYAPKELRTGAYLRLDAKGNYVASWEEVSQEELPEVAKELSKL